MCHCYHLCQCKYKMSSFYYYRSNSWIICNNSSSFFLICLLCQQLMNGKIPVENSQWKTKMEKGNTINGACVLRWVKTCFCHWALREKKNAQQYCYCHILFSLLFWKIFQDFLFLKKAPKIWLLFLHILR